jgi:CPA2 family monovalent cation:H+ antiporter-2
MEIPILQDILIIFALSVFVVLVFHRLKLPSVLGFLATGIIAGPNGLSLVKATHEVEVLSEIGVILLLFVIGIEFSLKQLASIKKTVFFGGGIQVGLTIMVTALVFILLDFSWSEAVFTGFLFSLSSTAIVLKLLAERNEINLPHGRMSLGVLIFQDVIVVPMMLFTPIIAGNTADVTTALLNLLVKSLIVLAVTYIGARYVIPKLLHEVARTKSKELFLLTTVVICVAVAWTTSQAGLSLALGAFLAGLIISESDYSHQATSIILPFRELFTSLFFVSIGMLLNISFFLDHVGLILVLTVLVIITKAVIAGFAARVLNYSPRTVILTGLTLFQVGEFAFILSEFGISNGLLSETNYQYFLSVSIASMAITPVAIMKGQKISALFMGTQFRKRVMNWQTAAQKQKRKDPVNEGLSDHLIIVGFGVNGKNVARAAKYAKIPYIIIEFNADVVQEEQEKGEPILYGDASHDHILKHCHVQEARVVVVAISDSQAIKGITSAIRNISQQVHLIIRTRYVKDIDSLIEMGADEVIPEEFETSIEIFSRVMHRFLVPIDNIDTMINTIRSDNYEMFRPKTHLKANSGDVLPRLNIECVRVSREGGLVEGKTVESAEVRKAFGVSIIALMRKNELRSSIKPSTKIKRDDLLYITGNKKNIERFIEAVSLPKV